MLARVVAYYRLKICRGNVGYSELSADASTVEPVITRANLALKLATGRTGIHEFGSWHKLANPLDATPWYH